MITRSKARAMRAGAQAQAQPQPQAKTTSLPTPRLPTHASSSRSAKTTTQKREPAQVQDPAQADEQMQQPAYDAAFAEFIHQLASAQPNVEDTIREDQAAGQAIFDPAPLLATMNGAVMSCMGVASMLAGAITDFFTTFGNTTLTIAGEFMTVVMMACNTFAYTKEHILSLSSHVKTPSSETSPGMWPGLIIVVCSFSLLHFLNALLLRRILFPNESRAERVAASAAGLLWLVRGWKDTLQRMLMCKVWMDAVKV